MTDEPNNANPSPKEGPNAPDPGYVLLLLSGGLDSTAALHYYMAAGFEAETLFIDYGQRAAVHERRASASVATRFAVPHSEIKIDSLPASGPGMTLGRNLLLLQLGLAYFPRNAGLIAIAIHSGTDYPDTTPTFVAYVQQSFDLYTSGAIRAVSPFIQWSKRDIWEYSLENAVPTSLTYSCETGTEQPCEKCLSCRDLEALRCLRAVKS